MRLALPVLALTLLPAWSPELDPTGEGARRGEAGAPVISAEIEIWGTPVPATRADAEGPLLGWSSHDADPDTPRLVATRLSRAGEALDAPAIPLHKVANTQKLPALAWDGELSVATWIDDRGRGTDLHATRLTPLGTVLHRRGLRLAPGVETTSRPRAVFDGSSTLVLLDAGH